MKKLLILITVIVFPFCLLAQKDTVVTRHNSLIADIEWSMPPRYVPVSFTIASIIVAGYNRSQHKYIDEYINPHGYGITLRVMLKDQKIPTTVTYRWTIAGIKKDDQSVNSYQYSITTGKRCLFAGSATVNDVGSDCETIPLLPCTGSYKITITATVFNSKEISVFEKFIQLKDYLVVAMGDSFVSGEGNPDKGIVFDLSHFDPSLINPVWLEPNAHRSFNGAIALIAARLENDDPHSCVTFLNVATSGAKMSNGLLFQQHPDWQLKGQIEEVKDYIKNRQVDMILMAIGLNDFGEVDGMSELIIAAANPAPPEFKNTHELQFAKDVLKNMQFRYLEVHEKIQHTLHCNNVALFQMPVQFMRNEKGELTDGCGYLIAMEDEDILRLEDLGKQFINKQKEVCAQYGWTYIDGISNLFSKHGYCAGDQSWFVHIGESSDTQGNHDGAVHPNKTGHQKIAELAYPIIRSKLFFAPLTGTILEGGSQL